MLIATCMGCGKQLCKGIVSDNIRALHAAGRDTLFLWQSGKLDKSRATRYKEQICKIRQNIRIMKAGRFHGSFISDNQVADCISVQVCMLLSFSRIAGIVLFVPENQCSAHSIICATKGEGYYERIVLQQN